MAGSERSPTLSSYLRSDGLSSQDLGEDRHLTSALRSTVDFGFTGTFVSEDTVVSGSLEIRPDRVIMWASGSQLASWAIEHCRVERLTVSRFAVHAEGETLTFTADDPAGLDEAISALAGKMASVGSEEKIAPVIAELPSHSRLRAVPPPPIEPEPSGPQEARQSEPTLDEPLEPAYIAPADPTPIAPVVLSPELAPPAVEAPADLSPTIRRPRIKNFQVARSDVDESAGRASELVAEPNETELAETETPAEQAIARSRFKRIRAARFQPSDFKGIGIKAGAVVLAAVVLGGFAYSIYVIAGGAGYEPEVFVRDPTTTAPPSTSPTTAAVATPPPAPTTLFQTTPAELTERWNLLAGASRPELMLIREMTSPLVVNLTSFMTLEGILDPANGWLALRSTPTGTSEGDGAILTSLGMMIAIADPTLEPVDRRLLLETLGLDVRNPQLGGIDGSLNYNGLNYRLAYLEDQNVLEFVISPETAVTTTTTA